MSGDMHDDDAPLLDVTEFIGPAAGLSYDDVLLTIEQTPQAAHSPPPPQPVGLAPGLPAGKLYHAFISHSREDEAWARNVIEKLESPEYGFKCCVADINFDLGVPVFQVILTTQR